MIGAILLGEWLRRGSTYVVGKEGVGAQARDNALVYCLGLFVVALGLAYVGASTGARLLGPEAVDYWPLLAALPALFVLQRAGLAILLGEDRIRLYAIVPVLFIVAYLGGNTALWLVAGMHLPAVLGVFAGAAGLAGLVAFAALWGLGRFTWGDGQVLRRTFAVGVRGAASVGLVFLLLRSDVFLIEYFLSETAVGSYRVAINFAEMMQRLPDVAGAVLLAKVLRGEDKRLLSLRVAQGILVFSIGAAAVLLVGGQWLIGLFFPAYPEAYAPLVWMLPGLVFLGFGSVCNTKLAGQGYPAITLWAAALAFCCNLALGAWFIPRWGLEGAALAKSIAYAIWSLLVGGYYLRGEGLGWGALLRLWALASTLKTGHKP
jgi:O-antigen/teichoic acid export membrane protein